MMVYKDRAWCNLHYIGECKNDVCYRAYTPIERERVRVWWGGEDFLLDLANMKTENCGYIQGEVNDGR